MVARVAGVISQHFSASSGSQSLTSLSASDVRRFVRALRDLRLCSDLYVKLPSLIKAKSKTSSSIENGTPGSPNGVNTLSMVCRV